MYKINKITKKRNGNYNLYLEDYKCEKFEIHKEILYRYKIYKIDEIDDETLDEALAENEKLLAKDCALRTLNYSAKTYLELKQKLRSKFFSDEAIDYALDFVQRQGFIDEEKVAENLVSGKYKNSRYSKRRMYADLRKRGISGEVISELTEDIDDDVEYENAMYYAKKKLHSINDADKNLIKRKIYSALSYRGFSYDTAKKVVADLLKEYEI